MTVVSVLCLSQHDLSVISQCQKVSHTDLIGFELCQFQPRETFCQRGKTHVVGRPAEGCRHDRDVAVSVSGQPNCQPDPGPF